MKGVHIAIIMLAAISAASAISILVLSNKKTEETIKIPNEEDNANLEKKSDPAEKTESPKEDNSSDTPKKEVPEKPPIASTSSVKREKLTEDEIFKMKEAAKEIYMKLYFDGGENVSLEISCDVEDFIKISGKISEEKLSRTVEVLAKYHKFKKGFVMDCFFKGLYDDEINIQGYTFSPGTTEEQKKGTIKAIRRGFIYKKLQAKSKEVIEALKSIHPKEVVEEFSKTYED